MWSHADEEPEDEYEKIRWLKDSQLKAGETWYLVSFRFYREWEPYAKALKEVRFPKKRMKNFPKQ